MAICFLCVSGKDTGDCQQQLKICSIKLLVAVVHS